MKEHLTALSTWIRGLFMLLFTIIFYHVIMIVMLTVVALQFCFMLFTGNLNENLLNFGRTLSVYVSQVTFYLTYNTEEKPFPFKKWPSTTEDK